MSDTLVMPADSLLDLRSNVYGKGNVKIVEL